MRLAIYLILGVLLFSSILFINGCTQQTGPKLEFSSSPCNDSINGYNQSELGIKDSIWLDNNTLLVKAYILATCACQNITKGDYEANGEKILLKYKLELISNVCATCMCAHELNYKFINIEKKDYQFKLEQTN